jgi:hypothetical protein|tara:strand:- start:1140 stop:1412 length:273 start_codon:yes stop_codon:yes gene_type:complete
MVIEDGLRKQCKKTVNSVQKNAHAEKRIRDNTPNDTNLGCHSREFIIRLDKKISNRQIITIDCGGVSNLYSSSSSKNHDKALVYEGEMKQ